jgi:Flp pilus assembly protein TadD
MRNRTPSSTREALMLAAASILVVLIYAGSLAGPFIFDDVPNIVENQHIRVSGMGPAKLFAAAADSPIVSRPIAYASFAVNYYFHGFNVVGYRFINILIHIANGFLLYGLTKATLRTPAMAAHKDSAGAVACLAALIWLVHPVHTQSVAYIVQRMTSLSTMFLLLSLLLYARARFAGPGRDRTLGFAGCAGAGLMALATKEIAATLPALLFAYEWFFFQNLNRGWLRRRLPVLMAVGAGMAAVALIYFWGKNPVEQILAPYSGGGLTVGQRLLTQARVVVFYLGLLIWPAPSRLNLDHDFVLSTSLLDPVSTLLALLALAALTAAAVASARREPLGSFAVLWFLGNLVIESSVIRLETVFEHRTYLPSVLPAAAGAFYLFRVLRSKSAAAVVLAAIAVGWAGWTYQRAQVWGDAVTLWQDCARKSPGKARPHNNLGNALVNAGRLAEALPHFEKAITIKPDYADAQYNLGYAALRLGATEAGIRHLRATLQLEPENHMAHNNLGIGYLMQEDYSQAVAHLSEAVRLRPGFEIARNNLGVALRNQGRLEEAVTQLTEAIRINPGYAEAHNNLGVTLKEQGNLADAEASFRRAIELQPQYTAARRNLEEIGVIP